MNNKITLEKLEKYFKLTSTALEKVKKKIIRGREKEAKEIIDMASNYLSDAEYFRKKGDFVNKRGSFFPGLMFLMSRTESYLLLSERLRLNNIILKEKYATRI